jgi:hypothetical protein
MYNDGDCKQHVFDNGKYIGKDPVFSYFFSWQLAGIYINKERACQVEHHTKNNPEGVSAVNEQIRHVSHLFIQVIK